MAGAEARSGHLAHGHQRRRRSWVLARRRGRLPTDARRSGGTLASGIDARDSAAHGVRLHGATDFSNWEHKFMGNHAHTDAPPASGGPAAAAETPGAEETSWP